jgi:hypothetical protein
MLYAPNGLALSRLARLCKLLFILHESSTEQFPQLSAAVGQVGFSALLGLTITLGCEWRNLKSNGKKNRSLLRRFSIYPWLASGATRNRLWD